MNANLRNVLVISTGMIIALMAGWEIANESFLLVGLIGGALLLALGRFITGVSPDALVGGCVLAGYLIGNRGFAQLSVPRLPLLPGEIALGTGVFVALWTAARMQALPFRRDLLNVLLLVVLAFGGVRLTFDVRAHGIVALRDFAIIYYVIFFFLAQNWWQVPTNRRWIEGCLSVGFALGAPVFLAFSRWPGFFIQHFSLQGVPLIYVKSDVQGGLLVAGTFWFLHRYLVSRRKGWLLLAFVNVFGIAFSNSRAALVALAVGATWFLVCRDWRALRPLAAFGVAGLAALLITPAVTDTPWKQSLAYRFYESAASVLDIRGAGFYESAELGDKPDNNLYRTTWWRAVAEEAWFEGRWLGLGFGYDLARQFTRIYYAEGTEEFSVRSPHNFPLTVFGRTGLIGLGLLLACLATAGVKTWRAGRLAADAEGADRSPAFAMWTGSCGIFVSACFGVVLEGPMGAAIFWTLLGMANMASAETQTVTEGQPVRESESVSDGLNLQPAPRASHAAPTS